MAYTRKFYGNNIHPVSPELAETIDYPEIIKFNSFE